MISLLLMLAIGQVSPNLSPVETSSTSSASACAGLCAAYRREAYEWRRVAKDLATENGQLLIGKRVFTTMLGKCLADDINRPACPSVVPWTLGAGAAGALLGSLAAGYVCSRAGP
jgi:hypothetical protein